MASQYGIQFCSRAGNVSRYSPGDGIGDVDGTFGYRWDLDQAEYLAHTLVAERPCAYVSFGNGEHEFRKWGSVVADQDSWFEFRGPDLRWAAWYVDVEINGHRWRYRPVADLDDFAAADELAETAATLHPHVTRVWVGASDGSEVFEHETRAR
jgi:hypothetical protein